MAIWRRGKPDSLLHHSDQGSQYTSEQFQRLRADHGITWSMSWSGNVWDNAAMESFFSSLKTERCARKVYRTKDDARADVFDYIERFYNPRRRHSTLGYLSPNRVRAQSYSNLVSEKPAAAQDDHRAARSPDAYHCHILDTGNDSFGFKNSSTHDPKTAKEKARTLTIKLDVKHN